MKTQSCFVTTTRPNTMASRFRAACAARLLPLLLLLALPAVVQAQFTYVTNNGAITITKYTGSGGDVTIPSTTNGLPVTSIGTDAFFGSSITSVAIPNSITNIGMRAFCYCDTLTSVRIPSSVITIGISAFSGCSMLANLVISNGVSTIKIYAFSGTSLTSVTIPSSVTNIGDHVFSECFLLTAITVDSLNAAYSSLGGVLYNQDQTMLIEYPPGKVGGFKVPSSVTNIANNGFYGCVDLTSVMISDGVASIGTSAFYACISLTNVTIPGSITNIGNSAFSSCSKLPRVTIPASVTRIESGVFSGCTNLSSVTISNGITTIGDSAFSSCSKLSSITIPESVTNIGASVFLSCSNMTMIYFRGNAPNLGTNVFNGDNKATVYYLPGTTGWVSPFGGRPAVLWNPQFQVSNASCGVRTNRFGFNITGTTNIPIVLEACTNLANPTWVPLQSCNLTNGLLYFSDPNWTNYPGRFYRIHSP